MAEVNAYAQKVFTEIVERVRSNNIKTHGEYIPEGIVSSVNDFIKLLADANDTYCKTFSVPDNRKLIIVEDVPRELVARINNQVSDTDIDATTLTELRIVTYSADEKPGVISAHRPDEDGIRTIKPRLISVREDTEHNGYSIVTYGKDMEAKIDFKVWGIDYYDIRERSKMLRELIETNAWFFKHKGLRDINWLGSNESEIWDQRNLVKCKSEKYLIRFIEIRELKEKNIEQIVVQYGLDI